MKRIFFPAALVALCSIGAWAQSVAGSGTVSGVILESPDSGLPDAKIVIENDALGIIKSADSSLDGVFEAVGLAPGPGYRLRVTRQKFMEWRSEAFSVISGERLHFEITLARDGEQARPSTGILRAMESVTRPLSATVDQPRLDLLPSSQHRADNLIPLSPATTTVPASGAIAMRGLTSFNAVLLDGLLANNRYFGTRSENAARIPVDSVQGMQVMAAADAAEFGHAAGGTVNVLSHSGTNGFHGRVYEYFSNGDLVARDRFAGDRDLFRKSNQPGLAASGKIPGTRLYLFSNLELYDAQGSALNRITNPLLVDATGSKVAAANCKATQAQCAKAVRFIQDQLNVQVPQSEHTLNGLTRLDYRRSDRNLVTLAIDGRHSRAPLGSSVNSVTTDGGILGGALAMEDDHSARLAWLGSPGGTSTNELRLGYFHNRLATTPSYSGLSTGSLGITVAGTTVGESHPGASIIRERRTQLSDTFRVYAGAHTAVLGVDWIRTRDSVSSLANSAGAYAYPSLTAFALDLSGGGQKNYNEFAQTFGTARRNLFSSEFGAHIQDSWLVTPKLRVTAGVRWSKPFLPAPTESNSTYYQTAYLNSPNINADPRAGVAYRLNDRTVLRGSFGTYHATHSGELLDAVFLGNGVYQSSIVVDPTQTGAPVFPNVVKAGSIPSGTLNVLYAATKLRDPYTKQIHVEMERDLGAGIAVTAGYLSSAAVKLWTVEDRNLGSTASVVYSVFDAAGRRANPVTLLTWTNRNNTSFAHVYELDNGSSAWYRAGFLQARKRMSHGLSANVSYTWSHAIDNAGGPTIFGGLPLSFASSDQRADKGSSATDQRHRAVIDVVWIPRLSAASPSPLRRLVNGWEVSTVTTLATGLPQTAIVVVNGQQYSKPSTAFYGSLNGTGGWSRIPFLPVNHLYSESSRVVNLRLARSIPITERVAGKLSFEAFNTFNSQFATRVQTIAYTATNSVLTEVPGAGTGTATTGTLSGSNARSCRLAFRLTF